MQNFARLDQKTKKILKNIKKTLRFFENPSEKWNYFTFLTKYLLHFWLLSESIYPWKIIPDFYNNFSYFGKGDVPAFLPSPDATANPGRNNSLRRVFLEYLIWFISSGGSAPPPAPPTDIKNISHATEFLALKASQK